MTGFTKGPQRFTKVVGAERLVLEGETAAQGQRLIEVVIKTHEPRYVPAGVEVRMRIDDHMFTARMPVNRLSALEDDPKIDTASVA